MLRGPSALPVEVRSSEGLDGIHCSLSLRSAEYSRRCDRVAAFSCQKERALLVGSIDARSGNGREDPRYGRERAQRIGRYSALGVLGTDWHARGTERCVKGTR